MFTLENSETIGEYLRSAISKKYKSIRQFCKAYLKLRGGQDNDDEEIRKLLNRFSQILKGLKRIQIDDLPYITELLDVSCEEVLSAGKTHVPVGNHLTNYLIAFSKDKEIWETYMKHKDKLFLNCDEYGKSVIDYAIQFKNYDFIKYLLDEHFIWFVDQSDRNPLGPSFGAGTSITRREPGQIDTYTPMEIQYQDRLRTQTAVLAIENNDVVVLDTLHARESPEMRLATMFSPQPFYTIRKDDDLIRAVAFSGNEKILNYFSDEFTVKSMEGYSNKFVFPYIGEVIDLMLDNRRFGSAEIIIKKAIQHNKSIHKRLEELIHASYKKNCSDQSSYSDGMKDYLQKLTLDKLCYDETNNLVKYYYYPGHSTEKPKYEGLVSNYVHVNSRETDPTMKELVAELNRTCDAIFALKGEKI